MMMLSPPMRDLAAQCALFPPATIASHRSDIAVSINPKAYLTSRATAACLRTLEGAERVIDAFEELEDEESKIIVTQAFANNGARFGVAESASLRPYSRTSEKDQVAVGQRYGRALETAILQAQSAEAKEALARNFMRFQSRRIVLPLTEVLRSDETLSDEDLDGLRFARQDLFFDGTMPSFMYGESREIALRLDNTSETRILVFGDFGVGNERQFETARAIRELHKNRPFSFGITVGDNFMPYGLDTPDHPRWETEWEVPYGSMGLQFFPVLGNHDYQSKGAPEAAIAYSQLSESWEFPGPYYAIRTNKIDLFALDTSIILDEQLTWLDNALKSSEATWKVVYGHHPIFSSSSTNDREPINLVNRLLPILQQHNVDAYFSGHDHALEEWTPQDDVHLFIVGAGGAGLYKSDGAAGSLFRNKLHGFGFLTVTGDALEVSFVESSGELVHRRTIIKAD